MRITTVIAAVFLLLCVLAACSREPGNGGDASTAPMLGSQQVAGSQQPSTAAPLAFFGERSLEERIVERDTVVVATLSTTTAAVVKSPSEDWSGKYSIGISLHLNVSEYLMGSGPVSITAVTVQGLDSDWGEYDTEAEAEAVMPRVLAARNTTWDNREAVFFLNSDDFNNVYNHLVDDDDEFFLSLGGVIDKSPDGYIYDGYSLRNRYEQLWLPSANTGGTGDEREFLLAVSEQGVVDKTITIRDLKKVISSVSAKLSAGDGSDKYRVCLRWIYTLERDNEYRKKTGQVDEDYHVYRPDSDDLFMESGQPAGVEVYTFDMGGSASTTDEDSPRTRVWLSGDDSGHFSVRNGSLRPYPGSPIGHVFDISVVSARPLPAGTYTFTQHYAPEHLILCNHVYEHEIEVGVSMQGTALHEFFFDPVTVGNAVAADSSNGVLKPASFTGADGASATIRRIAWESGSVKIEVSPHTALGGHTLEFIELDGSVSLSLNANDAMKDTSTGTLTWRVPDQPWHDGDLLMVRIRPSPPTPQPSST